MRNNIGVVAVAVVGFLATACGAGESGIFSQGLAQNVGVGNAQCVQGPEIAQEAGQDSFPCAGILSLELADVDVRYNYEMELSRGVGGGGVVIDTARGLWEVSPPGADIDIDFNERFSLAPLENYTIETGLTGCRWANGRECTMEVPVSNNAVSNVTVAPPQ